MPEHQTDDILIVFAAVASTTVPGDEAGWNTLQSQAGSAQAFKLYEKKAASSSETLTLDSAASDVWHIVAISVKGAPTSSYISTSAKRSATDNTNPFSGVSGASTGTDPNCLILQFCNSDAGLALTANPPAVNLVNGDAGSCGVGVAYTYQRAAGSIPEVTWKGRINDDTTAAVVAIKDGSSEAEIPAYADATTVGAFIRALSAAAVEGDAYASVLQFGAIGQRDWTKFWQFDGSSTYADDTTDINDVGSADVPFTANATNAAWYFGYSYKFGCMVLNCSTAISIGSGGAVWEYWNGSSWATLSGPTNPATGWVRHAWTIPSDWATVDVNGSTLYWIRFRLTGAVTTTPVASQGHVGGRLTTGDAIAAAGDAGVNPYMDAGSITPALTANFSGPQLTFGAAVDMDTGILIMHHKSQLARDYAVDPTVNDQVYPVTQIEQTRGGFILVLSDASDFYETYSIHGKKSLTADLTGYNVAAIGLNDGAQAFSVIGALNKAAITRALFLPQGENGAMLVHVSQMAQVSKIVFRGLL
jgi:hypothetical protein